MSRDPKLERHHQEQIQCLQALFGLDSKDQAQGDDEIVQNTKGTKITDTSPTSNTASHASSLHGSLPDKIVQMPDDWAMPWSNALLHRRIKERPRNPGCGGGMRRDLSDIDASDSAARFIAAKALNDLSRYTFQREARFFGRPEQLAHIAFYVIDFDQRRQIVLDTNEHIEPPARSSDQSGVLQRLFKQRTVEKSLDSVIVVNAFSPSALSTVLLCAAYTKDCDYATIYAALRRHLSTTSIDRFYCEDRILNTRHMAAFTISYFSVTDKVPATDCAPLSPSGSFSINAMEGKYICEKKFSVSWTGHPGTDGPSLMVVLNPLEQYSDKQKRRIMQKTQSTIPSVYWVHCNLFCLVYEWEEVLDALDTQTTLSSSVTFDSDARQGILFEDRNFSNSKRYFWALQSLRIFAEYIDGTLRILPSLIHSAKDFDGSPKDSTEHRELRKRFTTEYQGKFGALRDRIERKRQEVQSLSDGLFSASSVAEGRLATEQNGNIRLLTLVTIAYLPLNLVTPEKERRRNACREVQESQFGGVQSRHHGLMKLLAFEKKPAQVDAQMNGASQAREGIYKRIQANLAHTISTALFFLPYEVLADYEAPEPTTSGKRRRGAAQDPTRPSHEKKRQKIVMEDDGEGEAARDEIEDDGSVRTLDPTNHVTADTQLSIPYEAGRNQATSLEDEL
ncbi:MAG: hypothetical protein Q9226_005130 [Calogaya cf. arnoldii]